ncbi:hypothetical protein ASE21_14885 [Flavobacterium sp. Root901]|uniref:YaaC family protein n=1 Tax=Flavobacterium sp. Root901 TaxID=1736605 RepID=UPI00071055CE|nr:YaaC family protein [Flavobacterium sp. Root901]KRD09130.1 hypothetical protein ASE21_14885 [Flavobacterium sp. Root901]
MNYERIFTETPKTAIWDRIDILTTLNGVRNQLIEECQLKNIDISNDLLIEKSKGVAFCIRSARDLFSQSSSKNLTPSLTSLYYGTYNLLSALLIGDVRNELTLADIENFSKNGGHGLKTIYNSGMADIENNEFIYCCNNGFYREILKIFGYNIDQAAMSKNYKKVADVPADETEKLISLKDLLSRIPELKNIYIEIFREQPNYINFYASDLLAKDKGYSSVVIGEQQNSDYLTVEKINDILGLTHNFIFEYKKENSAPNAKEKFICDKFPIEVLEAKSVYRSPIASECVIKPLVTIDDTLLLYFKLLYILSIWTRYRPNLWREISEGQHDQFRSLFSIFADSTERIIPNLFLNRFYGRDFIFAGHSYWS